MSDLRAPRSTYRLQISAEFDLHAAAGVVDYLPTLGADWMYLSPLLTAEPGSNHGYDVVDHARRSTRPAAATRVFAATRRVRRTPHGLGVLVDIVPNHVGVGSPVVNRWWWDVLTHGASSRYAEAFDIDWEFGGGRLRIPVLGDEDAARSSRSSTDGRAPLPRAPLPAPAPTRPSGCDAADGASTGSTTSSSTGDAPTRS